MVTTSLYLILLAEVHPQHFGVALRPFDSVKSSSCGHGLLRVAVLTYRNIEKYWNQSSVAPTRLNNMWELTVT